MSGKRTCGHWFLTRTVSTRTLLLVFVVLALLAAAALGFGHCSAESCPQESSEFNRLASQVSDTMSSVKPVIVAASAAHTATFIFLHGLGDSGHGWSSTLAALKPPNVKLICPTANAIPVTLNGGLRMPSWFDLKSLDPNLPEDDEGIKRAALEIQSLIQNEIAAGIPSERIVLGGFSQGGALSLYTALTGSVNLGGVVALSSWLPLHKQIKWDTVKKPRTLQCHGDSDPLVHYSFGMLTSQLLKNHLTSYEFRTYPGLGHSSCDAELEDVKTFLRTVLSGS